MAVIEMTLITPYKVVFAKEVDYAVLRTTQGEAAVRPGHEPYVTLLDNAMVRAVAGEQTDSFAVLGGYATFLDDKLTIISQLADVPEKISETVEKLIAARAENEALEQEGDLEIQKLENRLRRVLVHMDISSYAILKGKDEKLD